MTRQRNLIVNAPRERGYDTHLTPGDRIPPYGSAVLVAHLRGLGFDVVHRDLSNPTRPAVTDVLTADALSDWLERDLRSPRLGQFLERCLSQLPPLHEVALLGISVLFHGAYHYSLALAKEVRRRHPEILVCLGGPFITIRALEVPPFVDYFVRGEGQVPLAHLAQHAVGDCDLDASLPGLRFARNGQTIDNGLCAAPADREAAPDFSDFELSEYLSPDPRDPARQALVVPYRTTLGCANHCSFCTGRGSARFAMKSPAKAVAEIAALSRLHERVYFRFCDASINNHPGRITAILDGLDAQGCRIRWAAYAKAHDMDAELLGRFARSGCEILIWGLDGVTPRMNRVFNKRYDIHRSKALIRESVRLGIRNIVNLIYGGPGETYEDVLALESFAREVTATGDSSVRAYEFHLEEGSAIFEHLDEYGLEILSRSRRGDFSTRERIYWKEKEQTLAEFRDRQTRTRRRMSRLILENTLIEMGRKRQLLSDQRIRLVQSGIRLAMPLLWPMYRGARLLRRIRIIKPRHLPS